MKPRSGRVHGWPAHPAGRPLNIAHRGASAHALENTLPAFEAAALLGSDMWEIDVRLTADGVPVVSHDAGISRVFGVDGVIAELSAADLARRAPDLPRLDAVIALAAAHGQALYVEIKAPGAGRIAAERLEAVGFTRAAIGSFDAEEVRRLSDASCPFPLSVLVRLGEDPLALAERAGADIVHLCWEHGGVRPQELVTPGLIAVAAGQGLGIVLWHEERADVIADLLRLPVLGVCTNQPELIAASDPRHASGIEMVCHRGSNRFAPENTLASARLSYDQGCAYVEVDVRETADGEIVVLHDPTLDRTTNGTGPVTGKTLAEVKALDAGAWFSAFHAGERVPTLRESIALCQSYGRQMYIENKSVDPAKVLSVVTEMDFLKDCFFWSGDTKLQAGMRLISPEARIKSNVSSYGSVGDMLEHLNPQIVEIGVDDYEAHAEDCIRAGAVPMMQYFGDSATVFDRIVALDPPMLNLDRSDLLLAALRRRA